MTAPFSFSSALSARADDAAPDAPPCVGAGSTAGPSDAPSAGHPGPAPLDWAAYRQSRSNAGMTRLGWPGDDDLNDAPTPLAEGDLETLITKAVNSKLDDMRAAGNHDVISTITATRPHIDNPA